MAMACRITLLPGQHAPCRGDLAALQHMPTRTTMVSQSSCLLDIFATCTTPTPAVSIHSFCGEECWDGLAQQSSGPMMGKGQMMLVLGLSMSGCMAGASGGCAGPHRCTARAGL